MLVRAIADTFERRALPTTDKGWRDYFRGVSWTTNAGSDVNERTAYNLSTVRACVRLLATSVAQLPLVLYQQQGRSRRRAIEHRIYRLLRTSPNTRQTVYEFIHFAMMSLALRGNALAFVQRTRDRVEAIWPLHWDQVEPIAQGAELVFAWRPAHAAVQTFRASDCWFVHGDSTDGVLGLSPLTAARESLGLALATQKYGGQWFGNGARPSGVLQTEQTMLPEAQARLRDSWQAAYGGENVHSVAVLEQGLKYQAISVAPEDSQFLETRKFLREEICEWFGVPPNLVGVQATHNNAEHQALDFVRYSLMPWLVNIEKTMERDLLTESERADGYYLKFTASALLRGDLKTRADSHRAGILTGWLTRNEARELEELDPLEGLDEPLTPLNMGAGADPGAAPTGDTTIPSIDETQRERPPAGVLAPVVADVAARIARAEDREVRKARERDAALELYAAGSDLRVLIARTVAPVMRGIGADVEAWVEAHAVAAAEELRHCGVDQALERWRSLRAAEIAASLSDLLGVGAQPVPTQPLVRELRPRRIERTVIRDESGRIARIVDQEV